MIPRTAAAAWSLVVLAPGCHKPLPASEQEWPGASASISPETTGGPVDHLGPDELLEGPDRAFGVALPRAMNVNGSFVDVVYARGPASVHAVTKYFRDRLQGGSMREGPAAATFEHVTVRGKPAPELLVRIAAAAEGASIEIRNATPPPAPALPDETARWKQVGLTPQGRIADPSHFE